MTKSVLVAALMLAFAGGVSAASYTNVPTGATTGLPFAYFGNAANPSGDSPKVGEVFSLSSASTLSSFDFYAIGNTSASFQLNVAEWNANNTAGSLLFTTSGSAVDTYNAAGGYTTINFSGLGVSLNANTKYIAYLTSSDPSVTGIQLSRTQTSQDSSGFGLGSAYLSTVSGWQLPFNGYLSLQYTAVTAPVPEPEQYALLLAGLGMIGAFVRSKKRA